VVRIFLPLLFLLTLSTSAQPKAPGKAVRLAQKDVAELVLKQGPKTAETNLAFLQGRLATADARKDFDWNVEADLGYDFNKGDAITGGNGVVEAPFTPSGASYTSLVTVGKLSKKLTTGTLLGVTYNHSNTRTKYDFVSATTPTGPLNNTGDVFGFTLEQSLFNNFFGRSDRAKIRAADETFDAASVRRADSLEQVVLDTLRAYWDAYTAKQTLKEALNSRERYKTLVQRVRRKSGYGYANPAELTQVQAEYEGQEQSVKNDSADYLTKVEALNTLLNLPPDTEIDFAVDEEVPPVPKLNPVDVEELRPVRAQKLNVQSATDSLVSARSTSYPTVNLVGNLTTSGYDQNAGTSLATATAGSHPEYYAGVKVAYNFGSDDQAETIVNRKATKELQETVLARTRMETADTIAQAERNTQAKYAVVQSAKRQKEFREKAVKELTSSYGQGRTDIRILIDAFNDQLNTEIALARAIGDYQIALNQWAAARDELIPDGKKGEK
jgi:outer membrane protein TolC